MNNYVKKITCLLLSVLTLASGVFATACKPDETNSSSPGTEDSSSGGGDTGGQTYDPEIRPLKFATDPLDGNFSPFFATAATDSAIVSMTQVGMMTTNSKGELDYGTHVPTVVLDYQQTMYDKTGAVTDYAAEAMDGGYTQYEFIIKNGMKFSDGEPLTIKDVLFNMYVYLDPYYAGSATLYSTDIKGLKAYRAQDKSLADDSDLDIENSFYVEADTRITNLLNYLDPPQGESYEKTEQIEKDIEKVKVLFREEAESDWTLAKGTQESYKDEYTFTEDWEIYYFRENLVKVQYVQGVAQRDENGKYITSLDMPDNEMAEEIAKVKNGENNEKVEYTLEYWMELEGCTREEAAEYAVQAYAIDQVVDANTLTNVALADVLRYWATGNNAREDFAAEAGSKYFADKKEKVEDISGITTDKRTTNFKGEDLGAEHDVLKVAINGVDPKAIWNFSFSVAPMHYYSNEETIKNTKYGVKFYDKDFFENVLKGTDKSGLPVGAGVYMASNEKDEGAVTRNTFYRNNIVYFKRNPYFYTMLGDGTDTANNAKIKYVQYRTVSSNRIMQALTTNAIDFGAPQATQDNIKTLGKEENAHLAYEQYRTNGYGYVGINPTFVPDIQVRQAIMKAMNKNLIIDYYSSELAELIERPMSMESWAYPKGAEAYYSFTRTKNEITALVEDAGWTLGSDGIYEKDGEKLELTFTIAGESVDHPAYNMFQDAATFLNRYCGFKVSVTTDITALKKLATGGLAVWAAAWNSTIDPDMYQVYHKDSKATSVKNWGYGTIFADTTGEQFGDEQAIIDELSTLIEEGREALLKEERIPVYAQALDLVMQLAVELPTYQRCDLVVYNRTVVDAKTLNLDPTPYAGVYDRLWEVNYL